MGKGRYAFPGARSSDRVMSEATINAALRRLGYTKKELTGHGFRSTSGTLLNEQGWHRDAIERQLAHAERDSVRAAYNRSEHLPERQKWRKLFRPGLPVRLAPSRFAHRRFAPLRTALSPISIPFIDSSYYLYPQFSFFVRYFCGTTIYFGKLYKS